MAMSIEESLFVNPTVSVGELPPVAELTMTPLEPAYRRVRVISTALFVLVILMATWGVALFRPEMAPASYFVAGAISVVALWLVYYQYFSFGFLGYAMRERDITFREGWLWRSTATVPFNRVQHCDIRQGIIERQFGLAHLTIYTAGGDSSDVEIPGLTHANAERMKSFILQSTEHADEQE